MRSFPCPTGGGFEYEIQEVVDCLNQGKLESDIMPLDETLSSCRRWMRSVKKSDWYTKMTGSRSSRFAESIELEVLL